MPQAVALPALIPARPAAAGAMRAEHVPAGGLKYWLALSAASVLGCNAGDWMASVFGVASGLPLVAAGFAATQFAERADRRPTQLYYWLSIMLVRTAATNLADLFGHAVGGVASASVLAAALVASMAIRRGRDTVKADGLPAVDALYWGRMLLAGTLGTALGDMTSFATGLGLGGASLALSAVVAALVAARSAGLFVTAAGYWLTVVAIRAAGTSFGDFSAAHLGLTTSFGVAAMALAAIAFFRVRPRAPAFAFA